MFKKYLVYAVACIVLVACSASDTLESKLNGTWVIDEEKFIEQIVKSSGNEGGQFGRQIAEGVAKTTAAIIRFNFDVKNKEINATAGNRNEKGKYAVLSEDGNTLKLKNNNSTVTITFHDNNSMTLSGNGKDESFPLKRAK